MPTSSPVYRRPSGIYAVRLVVPARLRDMAGKRELHVSTGQRIRREALTAALRIQLSLREGLMVLETHSALQGEGVIPIPELARLARCNVGALLTELTNLSRPPALFVNVGDLSARHVLDSDKLEHDGDSYIAESIEENGEPCRVSGRKRLFTPGAILSALSANGSTRVGELFADPGVLILDDWMPLTADSCLVEKSAARAIFPRVYRVGADEAHSSPDEAVAASEGHDAMRATTHTSMPSSGIGVKKPKKVSELPELIRQEDNGRVDADTTEGRITWINQFVELMGDMWAHNIDKEIAYAFAGKLREMPENIGHARRRLAKRLGVSESQVRLEDLAQEVRAHREQGKNARAVKRSVSNFSQIWNSAEGWGCMTSGAVNPFGKVAGVHRKERVRDQDARDVFSPETLGRMFSVEWFSAGKGSDAHWRPFHYWIPILCLYLGARVTEVAQLYLSELKRHNGVWCIEVTDERDEQSIKNTVSRRILPMHPELLRLGLDKYVEALLAAKHERLFPELPSNPKYGLGKYPGKWFNSAFMGQRLGIPRDGKQTTHSFRHTLLTALDRIEGIDLRSRQHIAGHERGKGETDNRYTKDAHPGDLLPIIEKLKFDGLPEIAPFDVEAGLRAVKVAMRRKKKS